MTGKLAREDLNGQGTVELIPNVRTCFKFVHKTKKELMGVARPILALQLSRGRKLCNF